MDPIEDFSEDDEMAAAQIMATAGRSPKHPRTGSEENSLDVAALFMDIKVDSMMDRSP